jgi:hypothetical protein
VVYGLWTPAVVEAAEREPVTLSVVVVNPSEDKSKVIPVRMDLPQEVTPGDVLERGDLTLEYDDDRELYYVFKESLELKPKETRVFRVTLRDKWFIPQEQIDRLSGYTNLLLEKLKPTEYYASASQLGEGILRKLKDIATMQADESLSRKSRIGAYRTHVLAIKAIEEDLARMEKLLTFTGGPPVPDLLEESPLKADAPSKTTTWLVIFLIVVFVGFLGGQFFFTWHRRTQVAQELHVVRQAAFAPATRQQAAHPGPAQPAGDNGGAAPATPATRPSPRAS